MKVNPVTNPDILRNYKTAKITPAKVNVISGRDIVSFSEEALSFSKVIAEIESRTQEELEHIAKITEAVRQGKYKIDSDKIADKILESVLRR